MKIKDLKLYFFSIYKYKVKITEWQQFSLRSLSKLQFTKNLII